MPLKRKRPADAPAAEPNSPPPPPRRRATRQTPVEPPPPPPAPADPRRSRRRPDPPRRLAPAPPMAAAAAAAADPDRPSDLVAPEITYHVPQAGRVQTALLRPHGPPPPAPARPPVTTPAPPPPPPRPDRNIDKVVLGNLCFSTWYPSYYGKEVLGDGAAPVLERLYVCPSCFKYARELVSWRGHVRLCERRARVPGRKIYVHPRGRRTTLVAHDARAAAAAARRRRGDDVVADEGEWSIWEVDGDKDGLFCQNLSLFAKLFLDNKSVFFDVSGFNYFLLVYTPPAAAPAQVTGFFSKEKMSWDNNNLACILVFPPWQRKGLGALLMGASYDISRREGILGGPEKPISDLGRRGYRRFWAGEVARWLLGRRDGAVDVECISRGTWIAPDDCLAVLRDMGVVEEADARAAAAAAEPRPEEPRPEEDARDEHRPEEPRVRLDKEAVRRYVAAHRIGLECACDPAGFVDGCARAADEAL